MVKGNDLEMGEEPRLSRWAHSNPKSLKAEHLFWVWSKDKVKAEEGSERNLLVLKMEEGSREP